MRTDIAAIAVGVTLWTPIAASMSDTIIPLPKQMKLMGREVALTDGSIVLATGEKKLRIAAEELNARIADVGARPLPVRIGVDSIHGACIVVLHAR